MRAKSLLAFALVLASEAPAATAPPVVSLPPAEIIAGPAKPIAVAPDGSWIVFVGIGGITDPDSTVEQGRVQVWNLKTGTLDRSFPAPGVRDNPVAVSPDGRWLAYPRYADYKFELRIYDFRTGKLSVTIRDAKNEPVPLGFSSDGKELYTSAPNGSTSKRVVAWSTANGKQLREMELTWYDRLTFSPDGKTVAVTTARDALCELWDLSTGKKLAELGRDSVYGKPRFLRGGKELALLYDYYTEPMYRVWEVGSDKKPTTIKIPGKPKHPLSYAVAGDLSATGTLEYYGDLRVFDAGKAEPRFTFALKAPLGEGPLFTPDGKRIIVVHPYERAWVLDAATGKPAFTLDADHRAVKSLAFTGDGKSLVAGMAYWPKRNGDGSVHAPDGYLLTWDTATGELKRAATGLDIFLSLVHPTPTGDRAAVVTGYNANQAEWWDLKTGKRIKILSDEKAGVHSFGGSADGKKFGGVRYEYKEEPGGGRSGYEKDVRVWDLTTGEVLIDFPKSTSSYQLRFTPDGKTALLRDYTVGVRAYPTSGGKPVTLWKKWGADVEKPPEEVVPMPDGESFVAYHRPQQYAARELYYYDIGRQLKLATVEGYTGPIAVSPDGKYIAVGTRERDKANAVYLWKLDIEPFNEKQFTPGKVVTGEALAKRVTLEGHLGEVFAVVFSPDGKTLATGGRDKVIRLWDVKTGKLKASLWYAPPTDPTAAPTDWVAFTPDGFHSGTARGLAFLRFADGDGTKFLSAEKVQAAIKGK